MRRKWQRTALFVVGVGGAAAMGIGAFFGVEPSPGAASGVGVVLAYVLSQLKDWDDDKPDPPTRRTMRKATAVVLDALPEPDPPDQPRNERGTAATSVAMFVVVIVTAGAAFYSASASNDANKAGDTALAAAAQVAKVTACVRRVQTDLLIALDERSRYTDAQFERTKDLENAQARYLATLIDGVGTAAALQEYYDAFTAKRAADVQASRKREQFELPDPSAIKSCN